MAGGPAQTSRQTSPSNRPSPNYGVFGHQDLDLLDHAQDSRKRRRNILLGACTVFLVCFLVYVLTGSRSPAVAPVPSSAPTTPARVRHSEEPKHKGSNASKEELQSLLMGSAWKPFGPEKIRGVNLGGWLVLEPWIRPSLFEQFGTVDEHSQHHDVSFYNITAVIDEWTYCAKLGKEACREQLEAHWSTWVTEKDIKALADGGLTHVRIPIGYWILGARDDEPYVDGSMAHLKRGLELCRKYGIKALLDLHCAPGSQNGFDNSGRKGDVHWDDQEVDGSFPNIERTVDALEKLATMFGTPEWQDVVFGIEPVNEPFLTLAPELVRRFYVDSYRAIRRAAGTKMAIFLSDSFRFSDFQNVLPSPPYENVFLDTHIYQVFDAYRLGFTKDQHVHQTCTINKPQLQTAPMRTIVGEWSLAITDCAQWLNGHGAGARYEGKFGDAPVIGSCEGLDNPYSAIYTDEYREFLKKFAEKQMDAYESGWGWFFWNFKTERAPEWNYLLGLEQGWMPKLVTRRTYYC